VVVKLDGRESNARSEACADLPGPYWPCRLPPSAYRPSIWWDGPPAA